MMQLITAPASEPITTTELKTFARISSSAEDTLLASLIVAARDAYERYTGKAIITQTWRQHFDLYSGQTIYLEKYPVASITAIKYYDTDGNLQTWASTNYFTDLIAPKARIVMASDGTLPTLQYRPNAMYVEFVAGGATASDFDKQIVSLIATDWYESRQSPIGQFVPNLDAIPFGVKQLILNNKIWSF